MLKDLRLTSRGSELTQKAMQKTVFFAMELSEFLNLIRESVRAELQGASPVSPNLDRNRWISMDEAIGLFPVTKRQLYQLSSAKKVATFKIGKPLLFKLGDLIDHFESKRRPSLSELRETLPAFPLRSAKRTAIKKTINPAKKQ